MSPQEHAPVGLWSAQPDPELLSHRSFGIQSASGAECSAGVGREGMLLDERNKFNNRESFDYSLKKAQISTIYDHARSEG